MTDKDVRALLLELFDDSVSLKTNMRALLILRMHVPGLRQMVAETIAEFDRESEEE